MPIFATLVSAAINGLMLVFSQFMGFSQAIQWARRTFIIALGAALITTVSTCVSSILGMISTSGLPARAMMGLGMVIPSNAGAVLSCMGSVWLACVVYRLKLEGLRW